MFCKVLFPLYCDKAETDSVCCFTVKKRMNPIRRRRRCTRSSVRDTVMLYSCSYTVVVLRYKVLPAREAECSIGVSNRLLLYLLWLTAVICTQIGSV